MIRDLKHDRDCGLIDICKEHGHYVLCEKGATMTLDRCNPGQQMLIKLLASIHKKLDLLIQK